MRIDFLYYEDCPSHEQALQRLRKVASEEGIEAKIQITKVESEEQANRLRFTGSPTIRVEDRDIGEPDPQAPYGLTCRAYTLEDGRISPLPSEAMIRSALRATA